MRKARQSVMANRSDRDPPSLHGVEGREAHQENEARIGRFHQGQRAQSPASIGRIQSCNLTMPSDPNLSLRTGRRPYKRHHDRHECGFRRDDGPRCPQLVRVPPPRRSAARSRARRTGTGSCYSSDWRSISRHSNSGGCRAPGMRSAPAWIYPRPAFRGFLCASMWAGGAYPGHGGGSVHLEAKCSHWRLTILDGDACRTRLSDTPSHSCRTPRSNAKISPFANCRT